MYAFIWVIFDIYVEMVLVFTAKSCRSLSDKAVQGDIWMCFIYKTINKFAGVKKSFRLVLTEIKLMRFDMAGHSKWANIKRRKEKVDAKRGKLFSRASKEIINAVKIGGSADPKTNNRLRLAIQKAKEVNFPSDNIDRLIKKAASADQEAYYEMQYELYGYGGVGIILDIMTDNKNRIASEIRIATNKCGGTIASPGSVAFNFDRKGVIQVEKNKVIEDELFLLASESGAEDFDTSEDMFLIITSIEDLYKIKEKLEHKEVIIKEASLEFIPKVTVECSKEDIEKNTKLIEYLEDLDDVDAVYHNMVESS